MKHKKRFGGEITQEMRLGLMVLCLALVCLLVLILYERRILPEIPISVNIPKKEEPLHIYAPKLPKGVPAFSPPVAQTVIRTGTASTSDASPPILAYAHGTVVAGDRLVVGMAGRTGNPFASNQIIVFIDPLDLKRYFTVTTPHWGDVETMTYDSVHDRVYFLLTGNRDLELYGLNPLTGELSVIASSTAINAGNKPAIVTDGTYVYGITNTTPSIVFKARIADGAISFSSTGHIPNGHSAAIGTFGSTTELYFGGGVMDGFEKTDAETLLPKAIMNVAPCLESDDMPYSGIDSRGGYVYVGCEIAPYGYRIRTEDMSAVKFTLPGASLGLFIYDHDLYNAPQDGSLDVFPGLDITDLRRYHLTNSRQLETHSQDIEMNEIFYSSASKTVYFTAWWGVPGVYRIATSTDIVAGP